MQYSPSIGNIWIRPNHEGEYVFCPQNLFSVISLPFTDIQFWNPKILDLNFLFWLFCALSLHIILVNLRC